MSCDVDVNELAFWIKDSQKKAQIKQKYLYISLAKCELLSEAQLYGQI